MDALQIAQTVLLVGNLLLGIFQSIKSNHFSSACCGDCWVVNDDVIMKEEIKT